MLNALSAFMPGDERIVTIEDAAELQLQQEHVVRLETRPPNIEGQGEITIRDLVRNALRMRPDRIIVGEVRGAEALDMLQAMNTGHDGSLTTIHANSPRDALARLEMLVLMAGVDLPLRAIREQIAGAFDLLIHLNAARRRLPPHHARHRGDRHRVGRDHAAGHLRRRHAGGGPRVTGGDLLSPLEASGLKPHFVRKMSVSGVALPPGFFHADEDDTFPSAFATRRNALGGDVVDPRRVAFLAGFAAVLCPAGDGPRRGRAEADRHARLPDRARRRRHLDALREAAARARERRAGTGAAGRQPRPDQERRRSRSTGRSR